MRYKMSAADQLQLIASKAPSDIPAISSDPFFGEQINRLYFAYPRFLLERLYDELLERLYFPWERVEGNEPLYIHIANTHHWRLSEVRQMKEDELLEILRPQIREVLLSSDEVDQVLKQTGDLMPSEMKADLKARIRPL